MITYERKNYSSSIVLIGGFSPAMFQPYWFKYFKIISDDEYNSMDNESLVVVGPVSRFQTDNFIFSIEEKRFVVIAKKEPFDLLLDLFAKLKDNMDFAVIQHFGINFSYHVSLETKENMRKFGDVIAPKKYWSEFFDDGSANLDPNGLKAMEMVKKTEFGFSNVKVEVSNAFKCAVFFYFNYHFSGNEGSPYEMIDVKDLLDEQYVSLAEYSNKISSQLIKDALSL